MPPIKGTDRVMTRATKIRACAVRSHPRSDYKHWLKGLQGRSVRITQTRIRGVKSAQHAARIPIRANKPSFARVNCSHCGYNAWIVFSNLVNATVTLYFSMDVWPTWVSVCWFSAVVIVSCAGLPIWAGTRRQPLQAISSQVTLKVIVHGSILAMLWGVIPALAFLSASHAAQLFIVAMTAGMICGGGFALATMPRAAYAYVSVMSAGAIIGALQLPLAVGLPLLAILAVYVLVIFAMIGSMGRSFTARLAAEASASQQQELVSLLLNDFQEHTSDWFWETDAEDKLCNVTPRLASILNMPLEQLEGREIVQLLVDYPVTPTMKIQSRRSGALASSAIRQSTVSQPASQR